MDLDLHSLGSTLFGGAMCLALARAYIAKMIKTVEEMSDAVQKLETTIAVLTARMDEITHLKKVVQIHDRQIAALMAKSSKD